MLPPTFYSATKIVYVCVLNNRILAITLIPLRRGQWQCKYYIRRRYLPILMLIKYGLHSQINVPIKSISERSHLV